MTSSWIARGLAAAVLLTGCSEPLVDFDASGRDAPADCREACATLAEGSCLDGAIGTCEQYCEEELADAPPHALAAFESCVSTHPLCYSNVTDCMWGTLHTDVVHQTYTYVGHAFADFEGSAVVGVLETNHGTFALPPTVVRDGTVVSHASVTIPMDVLHNRRAFRFFVDVDADGSCTPGIDLAVRQSIALHDDYDTPRFEVSAAAPAQSNDSVCGAL